MVKPKTSAEIEIMREGGHILAGILNLVIKKIKPGVGTKELNDLVEKLIKEKGGRPSFKGYKAAWAEHVYPSALCVSVNDEVVHGLAEPNRILKNGDIVGLDCGLEYKDFYTDIARTVAVGRVSKEAKKLMAVTEEALGRGIKKAKAGSRLLDVAKEIQSQVEKNGFSIVRQLVGHGVGYQAHEEPQVPNYISNDFKNIKLEKGMTLAIEPMVNAGSWEVETLDDGWTIVTRDGSLSAHFEHTIAVGEKGGDILTIL
ncbi:MAG: type I methionyl aminopeptidase [Patescibacteria group bacterium]